MRGTRLILLLFMPLLAGLAKAELVNTEVSRTIDVSSRVAITKTTVRMQNTGEKSVDSFYLTIHGSELDGLGDIWVTEAKSKKNKALEISETSDIANLESCCRGYVVKLSESVAPNAEVSVVIYADFVNAITAVPDIIEGYEDQYMRYNGNVYFFSPYVTKKMTSVITLGSSVVTSKEGVVEPFELKGKKLTLGSYEDVEALKWKGMKIRFRNNRGFLVAKRAMKEFYVSHWGGVAVKEELELVNDGARHSGEWSRVDHSMAFHSKYSNVVGDVWANLPKDAENVAYKDLVGNVTTSRLRKASKSFRAIQLQFRYPMVGQWRNHFWITYDTLLKNYGKSNGHSHSIDVAIFPSLHVDLLCEDLTARVLLPEGAYDIHVVGHASLKLDIETTYERTTLNFIGRPVVWLKKGLVRTDSKHGRVVRIEYKYRETLMWVTPLIVAIGISSLLLVYISLLRTEVAFGVSEKKKA